MKRTSGKWESGTRAAGQMKAGREGNMKVRVWWIINIKAEITKDACEERKARVPIQEEG